MNATAVGVGLKTQADNLHVGEINSHYIIWSALWELDPPMAKLEIVPPNTATSPHGCWELASLHRGRSFYSDSSESQVEILRIVNSPGFTVLALR